MGVVAMVIAVFCFWRFVSRKAAYIFIGFLTFGLLAYAANPEEQTCSNRAWFCPIVVDKPLTPKVAKPCPAEEPIGPNTPIFDSEAANAEVQRQILAGVCQQTAIGRVAHGWKAKFDPAYAARTHQVE